MTATFIFIVSSLAMNMFTMMSPLSMGVSILLMALTVAILFSYSMSSWIAFLIFLIYISGMLVMFAYFVSLTPNQPINLMSTTLMILITLVTMSILTSKFKVVISPSSFYSSQPNMFYLKFNSMMLIVLAMILLITMVIVVKLTINSKGPLRPFNYV